MSANLNLPIATFTLSQNYFANQHDFKPWNVRISNTYFTMNKEIFFKVAITIFNTVTTSTSQGNVISYGMLRTRLSEVLLSNRLFALAGLLTGLAISLFGIGYHIQQKKYNGKNFYAELFLKALIQTIGWGVIAFSLRGALKNEREIKPLVHSMASNLSADQALKAGASALQKLQELHRFAAVFEPELSKSVPKIDNQKYDRVGVFLSPKDKIGVDM